MNVIIRALTAVAVTAIVVGSAPASATEPRSGSWSIGIELRRSGPAPCDPATRAPCAGYVWTRRCLSPVEARVTKVQTYFTVAGREYVGFEIRVRLLRRNQPASGPWTTDVETITPHDTTTRRHLVAVDVGDPVSTHDRWDLQVQFRIDRSGARPDIVRGSRSPIDFRCS